MSSDGLGVRGRVNGKVAAIGGGALAAVLAGATILMMSGGGDEPGANGDPTARPTGSAPTAGPSATPGEPSPSAYATVPYDPASRVFPAAFDDGIDPADLPRLAERPGPSYPPAHVMQPWVWDHVGPGWGVALFVQHYDEELGLEPGPLMLYLLSPEGIYFEVREVAEFSDGADVTRVSLADRLASVYVTEEEAGWDEDIDLATGEMLATYNFEVEGGDGPPEHMLGTFAGGREVWVYREYDQEGTSSWTSDYSIIAPGSPAQSVVLPTRGFRYLGAVDDESAILFDRSAQPQPAGDRWTALRLDVESGSTSTVTALSPPGLKCDLYALELVGTTAATECPVGDYPDGDYVYRTYVVTWDGVTPARDVAYAGWHFRAVSEYADAAFSLTFDADSRDLASVSDTSAGGVKLVFRVPEPAAYFQQVSSVGPAEVAPGRFVFFTGYTVVAYDRASGDAFELTGVRIPDTGMPSTLNSYRAFGHLDE